MKILFVCTGNTCRSPMAKGIFKKLSSEKDVTHLVCDSAGISAETGAPATANAVKVCSEMGVDLSGHRSKNISAVNERDFDLFVAMTRAHGEMLKKMGVGKEKIYAIEPEICDPFGGNEYVYEKCRDELENAMGILIDSLLLSGDLN